MVRQRLQNYIDEGHRHTELLLETLDVVKNIEPSADYQTLPNLEKFALNTLIFRFSKLQDLLGTKLFRTYLDFAGFEVNEKNFFEILKAIEKEDIVDIDTWDEFRKLRNNIAHDYPQEEEEIAENIQLIIQKTHTLITVFKKLEEHCDAIVEQRG